MSKDSAKKFGLKIIKNQLLLTLTNKMLCELMYQQHRQEMMSRHVYGLDLASNSSLGGTASKVYMLSHEQQNIYKFLQMPLLNGRTLLGIPLHITRIK